VIWLLTGLNLFVLKRLGRWNLSTSASGSAERQLYSGFV
jgi:hypothetical protein